VITPRVMMCEPPDEASSRDAQMLSAEERKEGLRQSRHAAYERHMGAAEDSGFYMDKMRMNIAAILVRKSASSRVGAEAGAHARVKAEMCSVDVDFKYRFLRDRQKAAVRAEVGLRASYLHQVRSGRCHVLLRPHCWLTRRGAVWCGADSVHRQAAAVPRAARARHAGAAAVPGAGRRGHRGALLRGEWRSGARMARAQGRAGVLTHARLGRRVHRESSGYWC
jgi:hypothetical protein